MLAFRQRQTNGHAAERAHYLTLFEIQVLGLFYRIPPVGITRIRVTGVEDVMTLWACASIANRSKRCATFRTVPLLSCPFFVRSVQRQLHACDVGAPLTFAFRVEVVAKDFGNNVIARLDGTATYFAHRQILIFGHFLFAQPFREAVTDHPGEGDA